MTANVGSGDEAAVGASSAKPNVFFFLIDDMGYGDIGYQSTDLSELTPNLDALAAGGVKVGQTPKHSRRLLVHMSAFFAVYEPCVQDGRESTEVGGRSP